MGAVKGVAAFAAGFGSGYMDNKEKQRQREMEERRFKLEERRQALENRKLEEDQAMREKLRVVEGEVKPVQTYVVETPQGRMVYTDEKLAKEHAANDASAQVRPEFIVGGQSFQDKDSASAAAEAQNSPAVRMRRRAEVYQQYGREDLASAAMQNYKLMLDNSRREIQQQFLSARATGDVGAVIDAYNKQLPNGVQAHLVQGPNGAPMIQLARGSQPVGQAQPFNWDLVERQVMATPDNMVEIWRSNETLKLQGRQTAVQEGQLANDTTRTGAQVNHLNAQTADIPLQARDRATQAGAASTSAGAAASNARTSALQLTKPAVSAVPDAKGGLNFVTVPQSAGPTGAWSLGKPQVAPAPGGLQYPAGYVAGQRNSLGGLGLGGPAQPQLDPTAVEGVLQRMEEEARKRAAARGKGPAVTGQVGY